MYLFGRYADKLVGQAVAAIQVVMSGDDVFDSRAVFGFLQRQGADQNALVGGAGLFHADVDVVPMLL